MYGICAVLQVPVAYAVGTRPDDILWITGNASGDVYLLEVHIAKGNIFVSRALFGIKLKPAIVPVKQYAAI